VSPLQSAMIRAEQPRQRREVGPLHSHHLRRGRCSAIGECQESRSHGMDERLNYSNGQYRLAVMCYARIRSVGARDSFQVRRYVRYISETCVVMGSPFPPVSNMHDRQSHWRYLVGGYCSDPSCAARMAATA
jgi:hypothetical protein